MQRPRYVALRQSPYWTALNKHIGKTCACGGDRDDAPVRWSSIVNTSSTAGLVGAPTSIAYVAAKFAVTGMTKAAALDLGKYGIRVNSVHPGLVATSMMAEARAEGVDASAFVGTLPISRPAEPREIAEI
jgi:NAD(P)-dependent dehydrogenase (short-subunit alcohol dehydrogenase family)